MTGRKKTENERTAEIFAPFHEAAKRIEEAAKSGAWDAKPRVSKVTEIIGTHRCGMEFDGIEPDAQDPLLPFDEMVPPEVRGKRGRWRITVEFEPEEER